MLTWLSRRRRLGPVGERLAKRFLTKLGYRYLCGNFRVRRGEIDLVMQDGEVVVFVEVKARRRDRMARPASMVNSAKQKRIIEAARAFLRKYRLQRRAYRFDVVRIMMTDCRAPQIEHYRNAFRMAR